MPVTLADIERITARGFRLSEFTLDGGDGWLRLRNMEDHRCFFLSDGGRCRIHDVKPEGCRLYPFIYDESNGEVFRDDFCPHRQEFEPPPAVAEKVKELVQRLESEAAVRRAN